MVHGSWLTSGVETFEVVVAAAHHAVVDVAHPIVLSKRKGQSDDNHDEVGRFVAENGLEQHDDDDGNEESYHRHDGLPLVFHLVLARNFVIQRQGRLVVYSHLEQQTIDGSCSREQVGHDHQDGVLSGKDGDEAEQEGHDEYGAVEVVLSAQQRENVLFVHHEQVDVVALGTHDLGQVDGTEEDEGVEAPEVALEGRLVDVTEGYHEREEQDDADALDETAADGLVAHGTLDFKLQVFSHLSEAVQGLELADVLEIGLLLFADFIVDERHLQVSVDDE